MCGFSGCELLDFTGNDRFCRRGYKAKKMATPNESQDSLFSAVAKKILPPWDPLASSDWDKEKHSSTALVRIQR